MNKALTIIERIVIPHTAFADAQRQIEQCFTFSAGQGAQGLAIVGESGTGKTSLLESQSAGTMEWRFQFYAPRCQVGQL